MSVITSSHPVSPEDLQRMPDAVAYELIDGYLVERHMGAESSEIAAIIIGLLVSFVKGRRLGSVFGSDTSYQCFAAAPNRVRRADASFVKRERLPGRRAPKGNCLVAPDLAVEVTSPNDTAEEVDQKILQWLDAGVRLVWVVSPATRSVRIHRQPSPADDAAAFLAGDEPISGEDVLPGFACKVSDFFPEP